MSMILSNEPTALDLLSSDCMSLIAERRSTISSFAADWHEVAQLANKTKLPFNQGLTSRSSSISILPKYAIHGIVVDVDSTSLSIFQILKDLAQEVLVLRAGIVPFVETRRNGFHPVLDIPDYSQLYSDPCHGFIAEFLVVRLLIGNPYQDFEDGIFQIAVQLTLAVS